VFNNPTRFVDPSGYQLAYSEMPVFVNFGSSNWTYYSSGGGGSFLRQWDEQHKGSIGYNYNNGTYEYANGDIAGADAAINQLYRGNHNYKITFDGVNASQLYNSYLRGYDLYEVKAFGRSTYVSAIGTLGETYYSSDGAIGFSGMFAGVFIGNKTEVSGNSSGGGGNNFADYVELAGDIGGPIGSGAKNILDNRGAYMPRGQIYRMNKPVTVRTPVVNINTTSKVLNYTRLGGKVLVVGGVVATGYQVGSDIYNGDYYSAGARAAVFGVAAGAAFIPVVGWGVAIGIGVADFVWGDQFYNYVETKMGD
jgi:hypothetical protein